MNKSKLITIELGNSLEKKSNGKINKEIVGKIIELRSFVIDEIDYCNDLIEFYNLEKTCKDLSIQEINDILWKKIFDECFEEAINNAKIQLTEILLSNVSPGKHNIIKIKFPETQEINDIDGNQLTIIEKINENNKELYICKNSQNKASLIDNNGKILIKAGDFNSIKYVNKTIICTQINGSEEYIKFYDVNMSSVFINLNNSLFEYKTITDNNNKPYLLLISVIAGKHCFSVINTEGKLIFGNNHYSEIIKIVALPNGQLILLGSKGNEYGIFDVDGNSIYGAIDGSKKYLYFQNPITNEVYITDQNMETRDIDGNEIFPIPAKYKGKKFEISFAQTCEDKMYITYDKFMSVATFSIDINGNTKPWYKKFDPNKLYLKVNKIN